jgi:hypothetical protein
MWYCGRNEKAARGAERLSFKGEQPAYRRAEIKYHASTLDRSAHFGAQPYGQTRGASN